MHGWPVIHEERCHALAVLFTDERAMIHLADGRIIGVPLTWFPRIHAATQEQRQNYISYGDVINWEDLDDGIDLTAILTALYIVPVYQRENRSQPYVPSTWLYLENGERQRINEKEIVPFVQDTRNMPLSVRFTGDHLAFDLADGRVLIVPLSWFTRLAQATAKQRQNFRLAGLSLYWDELNVRIDLIAMLTGFYQLDASRQNEPLEAELAAT